MNTYNKLHYEIYSYNRITDTILYSRVSVFRTGVEKKEDAGAKLKIKPLSRAEIPAAEQVEPFGQDVQLRDYCGSNVWCPIGYKCCKDNYPIYCCSKTDYPTCCNKFCCRPGLSCVNGNCQWNGADLLVNLCWIYSERPANLTRV